MENFNVLKPKLTLIHNLEKENNLKETELLVTQDSKNSEEENLEPGKSLNDEIRDMIIEIAEEEGINKTKGSYQGKSQIEKFNAKYGTKPNVKKLSKTK